MDETLIQALLYCFDKSPEDALAYLKDQGVEVTDSWIEGLDAIKKKCFTVSKVASADLLQVIHGELVKAMESGESYDDFTKNIQKTIEDRGWGLKDNYTAFRWDLIYRMNLQTSYQNGRFWEMEAANDDLPYRQFIAIQDRRTTSGCNTLNNVIVHFDDALYLTNQTPRHFNCRSTWRALTKGQAGQDVKTGKDFPDITPEPGFGINPKDATYEPDYKKYNADISNELKNAVNVKI